MLKQINLSLSSACTTNCIFCPLDRGQRLKEKIMSMETIKRIVDEITTESFKKQHNVKVMQLGENGDCFLNPKFIDICRYIKKKIPDIHLEIFTNFANFTPEISKVVIEEKLIDAVWCNIDGKNGQNYYNVKKLDLKKVMTNLVAFLNTRNIHDINSTLRLNVTVLTLNNYIHKIKKVFGFYPTKLKDLSLVNVPDDYEEIKKIIIPLLKPGLDGIGRQRIFAWAEREKIKELNFSQNYPCPMLKFIKYMAFIAPDGTWYACCLDSNCENTFGNIYKESLNSMYFGEKRKLLLERLENREYSKIGGPCETIIACVKLQ